MVHPKSPVLGISAQTPPVPQASSSLELAQSVGAMQAAKAGHVACWGEQTPAPPESMVVTDGLTKPSVAPLSGHAAFTRSGRQKKPSSVCTQAVLAQR